ELAGDLVDDALVQVAGVGQHVRLVDEREFPPSIRPAGVLERVPDDPLDAVPRVHGLLYRNLVRRPLTMEPAGSRVEALAVLPDYHEVDIGFRLRGDEGLHAGIPDHWTEVDVLVELEPDPEKQVALEDPGFHTRVADGPEEDGVHPSKHGEFLFWEDFTRLQVPVGAKVKGNGLGIETFRGRDRSEHLQAFVDDLGPGPVSRDHPDPVGAGVHRGHASVVLVDPGCTCRARLMAAR